MGAAAAALCLALSPALAASLQSSAPAPIKISRTGFGSFTPAAADPKLAAAFARSTLSTSGFRFTPTSSVSKANRKVTVAVRARTTATLPSTDRPAGTTALLNIAPVAYNLGVSVGWKRFAISGDVATADLGLAQGRRQAADVGLSYTVKKWTTRVQLATERPVGAEPRLVGPGESVAVDFGGSYSLARNIDVTAGVRYKSERNNRLEALQDNRRDSQAVYLGTAFRF
ncbi:hypothetical protein D5I55_04155 [Chakrabartia godavariana]|nr:hypothetical protein D5I55_04155 [Chakrabartia godavariana]